MNLKRDQWSRKGGIGKAEKEKFQLRKVGEYAFLYPLKDKSERRKEEKDKF